jgi:hypothetical protein
MALCAFQKEGGMQQGDGQELTKEESERPSYQFGAYGKPVSTPQYEDNNPSNGRKVIRRVVVVKPDQPQMG